MRHLSVHLSVIGAPPPVSLPVRTVSLDDLDALAALMADAYTGAPDAEWADYDCARREVERIFTTWDGPVAPEACLAAFDSELPVSACLARTSRGMGCISYLMTAGACKNRGLGRAVLTRSLTKLRELGLPRAFVDVTAGNAPAERLYESLGFVEEWSLRL